MKIASGAQIRQIVESEVKKGHFTWNDYWLSCAMAIKDELERGVYRRIVILSDDSFKGRIGVFLAGILVEKRYETAIATIGDFSVDLPYVKRIGELRQIKNEIPLADCLIDCLDLHEHTAASEAIYRQIIRWANNSGVFTISCGIPCGIDADTGSVSQEHIHAHCTITFDLPQMGHLIAPACCEIGRLEIKSTILAFDVLDQINTNQQLAESRHFSKVMKEMMALKSSSARVLFIGKSEILNYCRDGLGQLAASGSPFLPFHNRLLEIDSFDAEGTREAITDFPYYRYDLIIYDPETFTRSEHHNFLVGFSRNRTPVLAVGSEALIGDDSLEKFTCEGPNAVVISPDRLQSLKKAADSERIKTLRPQTENTVLVLNSENTLVLTNRETVAVKNENHLKETEQSIGERLGLLAYFLASDFSAKTIALVLFVCAQSRMQQIEGGRYAKFIQAAGQLGYFSLD